VFSNNGLTSRTVTFILAGGNGRRLRPLTLNRAKPLVPFCGTSRLIDFTLSNCVNSNLRNVYALIQHKHAPVAEYVEGKQKTFRCLTPKPGKLYNSTADAILQNLWVLEQEGPQFVLVLSASHIQKMDYIDLLRSHADSGAHLTMMPAAAIYVFNTGALVRSVIEDGYRKKTEHDLSRNVIPALMDRVPVNTYNFAAGCKEIGTIDDYYRAQMELLPMHSAFDSIISPDAQVDPAAHIESSIVLPGVRIGRGARIRRAIIDEFAVIPDGAEIGYSSELDRQQFQVSGAGIVVVPRQIGVTACNCTSMVP
jgi:glucose-1-phosphate adenylyltransferase